MLINGTSWPVIVVIKSKLTIPAISPARLLHASLWRIAPYVVKAEVLIGVRTDISTTVQRHPYAFVQRIVLSLYACKIHAPKISSTRPIVDGWPCQTVFGDFTWHLRPPYGSIMPRWNDAEIRMWCTSRAWAPSGLGGIFWPKNNDFVVALTLFGIWVGQRKMIGDIDAHLLWVNLSPWGVHQVLSIPQNQGLSIGTVPEGAQMTIWEAFRCSYEHDACSAKDAWPAWKILSYRMSTTWKSFIITWASAFVCKHTDISCHHKLWSPCHLPLHYRSELETK